MRSPAQKLRVIAKRDQSIRVNLGGICAGSVLASFVHWCWADMPVIAKFCGIVIRFVIDRTFGVHVHAFYGDSEMVVGLNPIRVIQGDVPPWVQDWVLWWMKHHQSELLSGCKIDLNLATPISRQAASQLVAGPEPLAS